MFLWSPIALPMATEGYTFKKLTAVRHPQKVYNVIPGDFTQDGRLDLLVYGQSSNSNEVSVQLYVALPQGKFGEYCSSFSHIPLSERVTDVPIDAPASISAQPIPMDINGDLKIDLFGVTPSSPSTFKVWQNVWNASQYDGPVFNMCITTYFSHRNILIIVIAVSTPSWTVHNAHSQTHTSMLPLTSTETVSQVRISSNELTS